MGSMLVFMADEQADGEDAAIEFLTQHEDLVDHMGFRRCRRENQSCSLRSS